MLNYVKTFFSYPSPPLSQMFSKNMFNILRASKIRPKTADLQSASIGSDWNDGLGFLLPKHQRIQIGINRLKIGMLHCQAFYLYFVSQPSMQVLPGLTAVSILMVLNGETDGWHLPPVKTRAFRIDVCNMCLPWAITNMGNPKLGILFLQKCVGSPVTTIILAQAT